MARVITLLAEAEGRCSLALGMEIRVPITTTNNSSHNLDEVLGWGWIGLCIVLLPRRRGYIGMTGSIRARRRMVGTRAGLTFCLRLVGRAPILLYLGSVEEQGGVW
jgi:hypothetical protein